MLGKHSKQKRHRAGKRGNKNNFTMLNLSTEEEAVIADIPDETLLPSLGIRKGKRVKAKSLAPFGGPIIVAIGNRNIAVSRSLADQIKLVGDE